MFFSVRFLYYSKVLKGYGCKVFERIGVWGKENFSQKVSLSPQKIKLYFCFFLNCEGDIPVCAFTHFERYLASANDSMSAISFKV